jgi:hypothetical protein
MLKITSPIQLLGEYCSRVQPKTWLRCGKGCERRSQDTRQVKNWNILPAMLANSALQITNGNLQLPRTSKTDIEYRASKGWKLILSYDVSLTCERTKQDGYSPGLTQQGQKYLNFVLETCRWYYNLGTTTYLVRSPILMV